MSLSLLIPKEIEAEYLEKEYKLVDHEKILLNKHWPEAHGFWCAAKSYPLNLKENQKIVIHVKNNLELFAKYRLTIREGRWGEVLYEIEPNQGASVKNIGPLPKQPHTISQ